MFSIRTIESQPSWEQEWGKSLRTASDLFRNGFISELDVDAYESVLKKYRFVLPRYYSGLIDKRNPKCPIRLQAIPSLEETSPVPGLVTDPLADLEHQPVKRLTHRYPNRVLVHLTSNCSMYCRYCFRKTLLNELSPDFFGGEDSAIFDYLRAHSEIEEVILSGGDPLMVSDARLRAFVKELETIDHIRRLRFHTRVPVTFPERVTDTLIQSITSSRLPVILVTHFNHPKEMTAIVSSVCSSFAKAGITLLNQSVLLKGVNDNADVLKELSERLFENKILPYYLHHPDRAQGTHAFDLEQSEGLQIYTELRKQLPGYLVPKYVVDNVGTPFKTFLS